MFCAARTTALNSPTCALPSPSSNTCLSVLIQLIVNTLGATQINVSLALSCIEAQLWVQSTVAAIIREGEEGTLPTEIRKIIWDNATKFEREFQSWWQLVHFPYEPTTSKTAAFLLTIRSALVYTIYPIIALGLKHN